MQKLAAGRIASQFFTLFLVPVVFAEYRRLSQEAEHCEEDSAERLADF